jgi:hypothetical protein
MKANPEVATLCGEYLCMDLAEHACRVIGGPTLNFCGAHARKMVEAALEAGVAAKIEMLPPVDLTPAEETSP